MRPRSLRNGHHPISRHRRAKDTIETTYPIGFGCPSGINSEAHVVEGVDQATRRQLNRAPEVVGMHNIRPSQRGFCIRPGPEYTRRFAREMPWAVMHVPA